MTLSATVNRLELGLRESRGPFERGRAARRGSGGIRKFFVSQVVIGDNNPYIGNYLLLKG